MFNDFPTGSKFSRDVIDNGFLNSRTMWQCNPFCSPSRCYISIHRKNQCYWFSTSIFSFRYSNVSVLTFSSNRYQIYLMHFYQLTFTSQVMSHAVILPYITSISFAINQKPYSFKFVMFKQTLLKRLKMIYN